MFRHQGKKEIELMDMDMSESVPEYFPDLIRAELLIGRLVGFPSGLELVSLKVGECPTPKPVADSP